MQAAEKQTNGRSPTAIAALRRVLDGAARRLLDEQLAAQEARNPQRAKR